MRILFLVECAVILWGAAASAEPPDVKKGIEAFSRTVYAFAQKQHCVYCHGKAQDPLYAQPDVTAAYWLARNYTDFSDPESSTFVYRSRNGHCGAICQTDGTGMAAAIRHWWDEGEKEVEGGIPKKVVTARLKLPTPLAEGDDFNLLEWKLDAEGLSGARFRLEIQRFDDASYRVREPRLLPGSSAVRVRGIRVLVNGHYAPEDSAYLSIAQTVSPKSPPVLSSAEMLVTNEDPGKDELSISFGEIHAGDPLKCRAPDLFQKTIRPILERKCARCHADRKQAAYQAYAMDEAGELACESARRRVDGFLPLTSAFLVYPLFQTNGHPVQAFCSRDERLVTAWMSMELGIPVRVPGG
jgi:hypothetical protein